MSIIKKRIDEITVEIMQLRVQHRDASGSVRRVLMVQIRELMGERVRLREFDDQHRSEW